MFEADTSSALSSDVCPAGARAPRPPAALAKNAPLGPAIRVRYLATDVLAVARQVEGPGQIETSFEGVADVIAGDWYVLDGCDRPSVSVWPAKRFAADFSSALAFRF